MSSEDGSDKESPRTLRSGKILSTPKGERVQDGGNRKDAPNSGFKTPASKDIDSDEEMELRNLQELMLKTPKQEWSKYYGKHNLYDAAVRDLCETKGASAMSDATFKKELIKMVEEYSSAFPDGDDVLKSLHDSLATQLQIHSNSTVTRPKWESEAAGLTMSADEAGLVKNNIPDMSLSAQTGGSRSVRPGIPTETSSNIFNKRLRFPTNPVHNDGNMDQRPESHVNHDSSADFLNSKSKPDVAFKSNLEGAVGYQYDNKYATPIRKASRDTVLNYTPRTPLLRQSMEDPAFVQDLLEMVDSGAKRTPSEAMQAKQGKKERRRSAYDLPDTTDSEGPQPHFRQVRSAKSSESFRVRPMRTVKLPDDLKFDGTEDWHSFHTNFKMYVSGYEEDGSLVPLLMKCLTGQARQLVSVTLKQIDRTGQPPPDYEGLCRILARNYYRADDISTKLSEFQSATQSVDETHVMFRNRLSMLYIDAFPEITEDVHEANVHARFIDGIHSKSKTRIWASKDKSSQELARILDDLDIIASKAVPKNAGHTFAVEDTSVDYDYGYDYEYDYPYVEEPYYEDYGVENDDYYGTFEEEDDMSIRESETCAANVTPQSGTTSSYGGRNRPTFRRFRSQRDNYRRPRGNYPPRQSSRGRGQPRFQGQRSRRPNFRQSNQSRAGNSIRGYGTHGSYNSFSNNQHTENNGTKYVENSDRSKAHQTKAQSCSGCGVTSHKDKDCPVLLLSRHMATCHTNFSSCHNVAPCSGQHKCLNMLGSTMPAQLEPTLQQNQNQ